MGVAARVNSTTAAYKYIDGICPYGWKCPIFIGRDVRGILPGVGNVGPVMLNRKKCYICRGLLKRLFRVFITIRLPPYVEDPRLDVELLRKFVNQLKIYDNVRFVAVISVGKVAKVDGRYRVKYERPHLHILVGAKDRVGWRRLRRGDQVRILRKFIADVHRWYSVVLGPEYPGAIDVRWIRYQVRRRRRRRRERGDDRARTPFRLRLYMSKQLAVPDGIYVHGIHVRRLRKLPSTDVQNLGVSGTRAYAADDVDAGGLGGYSGSAARRDGRGLWVGNARRLLREVVDRGSFAGVALDGLSRRLVRKVLLDIVAGRISDVDRVLWVLYEYAVSRHYLFDEVRRVRECWEQRRCGFDEVVKVFSRVLAVEYESILAALLNLKDFDSDLVKRIFRSYVEGVKRRVLEAAENRVDGLELDLGTILTLYLRYQALSRKVLRRWLRDLDYIEMLIDSNLHQAYVYFVEMCRSIARTVESRYRYVKSSLELSVKPRRRYGDRRVGTFVKKIRVLLRQVRWFRDVIADFESLDMLRFYDVHGLREELRTRLRDSSLCFFFANHVICVGIDDVRKVLDRVRDSLEELAAYARYCLGLKVKAETPCVTRIWLSRAWVSERECREILCSESVDRVIERVDELIKELSRLRARLTARAKMRKRRYRARLRKLRYKLSKIRALDEWIYGRRVNAFERALNAFRAWLLRRRYPEAP